MVYSHLVAGLMVPRRFHRSDNLPSCDFVGEGRLNYHEHDRWNQFHLHWILVYPVREKHQSSMLCVMELYAVDFDWDDVRSLYLKWMDDDYDRNNNLKCQHDSHRRHFPMLLVDNNYLQFVHLAENHHRSDDYHFLMDDDEHHASQNQLEKIFCRLDFTRRWSRYVYCGIPRICLLLMVEQQHRFESVGHWYTKINLIRCFFWHIFAHTVPSNSIARRKESASSKST